MPRPDAAPAVAVPHWILGPWRDLLLFVATPLLIVPAALGLRQGFASKDIQYFVLAFGAMGHNLPGMLRAYGDRALFRRFWLRFLLAPIVFAGLAVAFAARGSNTIVLLAFFWAVWHALMQIYGFLRIYDAKVGSFAPRTARLDLTMCLFWFGAAVLWSDARVYYVQEMLIGFGIPPVPADALRIVRYATLPLLGVVTTVFVVHQLAQRRAGTPVNPVKNLLIVSSIVFWWWAHVLTADVLLGLILFEVFHDVQYLSIVWIFNRRRVDTDPQVGGFTRFVFRRSFGMIGLYVGLVFAYGGIVPWASYATGDAQGVFATIIVTSALLHYYYDGFIWKVRERNVRQGLGMDGARGDADRPLAGRSSAQWLAGMLPHAAKWLLLFVPLGALSFVDDSGRANLQTPSVAEAQALAASTPDSAVAQFKLGQALNGEGRHVASLPALRRSLEIVPGDAEVELNLALARLEAGREELAHGREAQAREFLGEVPPAVSEKVVGAWNSRGWDLWNQRRLDAAALEFRAAILARPDFAFAHLNLALVYRAQQRRDLALQHARIGASLRREDPKAQDLVRSLLHD